MKKMESDAECKSAHGKLFSSRPRKGDMRCSVSKFCGLNHKLNWARKIARFLGKNCDLHRRREVRPVLLSVWRTRQRYVFKYGFLKGETIHLNNSYCPVIHYQRFWKTPTSRNWKVSSPNSTTPNVTFSVSQKLRDFVTQLPNLDKV